MRFPSVWDQILYLFPEVVGTLDPSINLLEWMKYFLCAFSSFEVWNSQQSPHIRTPNFPFSD